MLPSFAFIDNKMALFVVITCSLTLIALSLFNNTITPSLGLILSSTFPPFLFHFSFLSCSSNPLLISTPHILFWYLVSFSWKSFLETPLVLATLLHLVSLVPECFAISPFFLQIFHFPYSGL